MSIRTVHPFRSRFLGWIRTGATTSRQDLNSEPSHIYHFKGRVARCSGFNGAGSDGKGERLLFGTKTTDYGIMDGEYWAARTSRRETFTHI